MRFDFLVIQRTRLSLAQQVGDPRCNRLYDRLRALALKEPEHVEIAVALGDRGPKLAGDLHHWLHFGAIDFHLVDPFTARFQGFQIRLPIRVLVDLTPGVPEAHELVVTLEITPSP